MRIILLDKIDNLGNVGETVDVKSGYARNFLIPRSQAVLATQKNIEWFKMKRISLEDNLKKLRSEAELLLAEIKKIGFITIVCKSGISGKLFGSIGTREIADTVTKLGIKISRYNVCLPNGKIRYLGNHNVVIKIYREIFATLSVHVVNS